MVELILESSNTSNSNFLQELLREYYMEIGAFAEILED